MKNMNIEKFKRLSRFDQLDTIREMIVTLCDTSFNDWGCVNDADLDDIMERIENVKRKN